MSPVSSTSALTSANSYSEPESGTLRLRVELSEASLSVELSLRSLRSVGDPSPVSIIFDSAEFALTKRS